MMNIAGARSPILAALAAAAVLTLGACGGGDFHLVVPDLPPVKYAVGGTAIGLAPSGVGPSGSGSALVLANGADTLSVPLNGAFAFPTWLTPGTAYDASIKTQPGGYTCQLQNGKGTVGNAPVTTITVTCAPIPS